MAAVIPSIWNSSSIVKTILVHSVLTERIKQLYHDCKLNVFVEGKVLNGVWKQRAKYTFVLKVAAHFFGKRGDPELAKANVSCRLHFLILHWLHRMEVCAGFADFGHTCESPSNHSPVANLVQCVSGLIAGLVASGGVSARCDKISPANLQNALKLHHLSNCPAKWGFDV